MSLRRELALFAVGGVLGFMVDAGIVQALVRVAGWNPYTARVLSFLAAATVTWIWNRKLTFAQRRVHQARSEWLRWMAVMGFGAFINYGLYAALVALFPLVRLWPVLGVAAGSAAAALVNFCAARALVFPARKNPV